MVQINEIDVPAAETHWLFNNLMQRNSSLPECTVALAHAHAAQHTLLIGTVLPQELADDVASEAEAHYDELALGVGLLYIAHHRCKLPCTAYRAQRRNVQKPHEY